MDTKAAPAPDFTITSNAKMYSQMQVPIPIHGNTIYFAVTNYHYVRKGFSQSIMQNWCLCIVAVILWLIMC